VATDEVCGQIGMTNTLCALYRLSNAAGDELKTRTRGKDKIRVLSLEAEIICLDDSS
jgi:hypothetical protein